MNKILLFKKKRFFDKLWCVCVCVHRKRKRDFYESPKRSGRKTFFVTFANLFLLVSSFLQFSLSSTSFFLRKKETREILLHYVWTKAIDYRLVILMQNIFEFLLYISPSNPSFAPIPHHSLRKIIKLCFIADSDFRFVRAFCCNVVLLSIFL